VELEPPTSTCEGSVLSEPMPPSSDEFDPPCCPCGVELEARHTGQPLCAKHQQQIAGYVGRRFGRHRYGGRYASFIEDFVQDCYRKLAEPSGLGTFRPDASRERADAFGAWLGVLLRNHCNNKLKYGLSGVAVSLDASPEPVHEMTPAQAFARQCLHDLLGTAVDGVEADWRAKGSKASQRFDVFLPFVLGEKAQYKQAQEVLGVSEENAKKIKCNLAEDTRIAARRLVRDTLDLEPGLDRKGIERRIDEEIGALFDEAFPPGAETPGEHETKDEQPEPQP
jgi:hypothetical protein